jgi:hypothetical protein
MQANPLRADAAAASSETRAACVLRAVIMPQIVGIEW